MLRRRTRARTCRVCGCTAARACPGGCAWADDPHGLGDLCTACLPAEPQIPHNVKLLHDDGTEQPLDCRYLGVDEGVHVWEVILDRPVDAASVHLYIERLPARTAVVLPIR